MLIEHPLAQRARPLLRRRVLLKQLLQAGLMGGVGMKALTGCTFPSQSPVTINWVANGTSHETFQSLATYFNRINQSSITVNAIQGTDHKSLVKQFQKRDNTFDLVSLDVTWMREFISHNWLKPLDDYWPANSEQLKRTDYLEKPLQICSRQGKLWAAPLHTDVGILYYRTDSPDALIPPSDADKWMWEDLARMAKQAQESQWCSGGFLWEANLVPGQEGKGLMCLFLEFLDGFGGQLFDNADDPQRVLINSPEAINALEHMKIWNTTISAYTIEKGQSKKASDSDDSDCAMVWEEGHAAFMRNWPHYIANSDNANHANNAVAEKYSIAPLPRRVLTVSNQQRATHSCLGGWQLAINTYSSKPKQDAAWQFIQWMLGPVAQQYLAYNENFAVTLKSVYDDPHINALNPHYKLLLAIISNAQYRPLLPNYMEDVAMPVQATVSRVLTDNSYTTKRAVQDLAQQLQKALDNK
jgi:multiple sugar transport system substrate-binding protein